MPDKYSEAIGEVLNFLSKGDPDFQIDDETNLFERGVLDSLQFMEIIFLLEALTQTEIDVSDFDILDVSSLGRMKEKILFTLKA